MEIKVDETLQGQWQVSLNDKLVDDFATEEEAMACVTGINCGLYQKSGEYIE